MLPILWFIILVGLFQTMYWFAAEETKEKPKTVLRQALILAFGRNIWAICISLVAIICITGHSKRANDFLSNNDFQNGSKLSYGIYLLHDLVINVNYASYTHSFELSVYFIVSYHFYLLLL